MDGAGIPTSDGPSAGAGAGRASGGQGAAGGTVSAAAGAGARGRGGASRPTGAATDAGGAAAAAGAGGRAAGGGPGGSPGAAGATGAAAGATSGDATTGPPQGALTASPLAPFSRVARRQPPARPRVLLAGRPSPRVPYRRPEVYVEARAQGSPRTGSRTLRLAPTGSRLDGPGPPPARGAPAGTSSWLLGPGRCARRETRTGRSPVSPPRPRPATSVAGDAARVEPRPPPWLLPVAVLPPPPLGPALCPRCEVPSSLGSESCSLTQPQAPRRRDRARAQGVVGGCGEASTGSGARGDRHGKRKEGRGEGLGEGEPGVAAGRRRAGEGAQRASERPREPARHATSALRAQKP